MSTQRCPQCGIPYLEEEVAAGTCPMCEAQLFPDSEEPEPQPLPPPGPTRLPAFLVGLFVGAMVVLVGLGTAYALGWPFSSLVERSAEYRALLDEKDSAEQRALEAEARYRIASSRYGRLGKTFGKMSGDLTTTREARVRAEQKLNEALARLEEANERSAHFEKSLANERKRHNTRSFARNWQLIGPFDTRNGRGRTTVFPPEESPFDQEKEYNGLTGKVKWRPHTSDENRIDLARFFGYDKEGLCYAVCWVHVEKSQTVTLSIGSDDGIRVWVNRKRAHDNATNRAATPGQDHVAVKLKQGWNEILAKVDNGNGDWEFYLEFRTKDRRKPLPLYSTNLPPLLQPDKE